MHVGIVDLAVLLAYMAGIVVLGMWLGRGARDVADYAVGGRDQPWWLILFSIIATETSAVTFLSIPGFAYERDFTWIQIALGFVIGRFAIAFLLLPEYFRGVLFTSYEVLHRRFGGATQQTASVLFIVTRSLADGLRLFLSAIVLQEMTGIPIEWAVAALGVTTIVYTYLGGMRAVLWSDLIQFFLYLAGAIVAFAAILARLPGGWDQLAAMGQAAGKFRAFDLRLDWSQPYGLWAGLVGGAFIALGSHGVDQLMVQRYLSARGLPEARRALWVSGLLAAAQFALFLLIGVGLWSFYQLHPPAVPFDRPDRVFARFILDELPVGLVGLLLGAIFAAAMTSSLNSCATVAVNDLYVPLAKGEVPAQRQLRMTRVLTAVFGAVQIAVGIAGQWLKSSIVSSVLGIAAFTTGIVLGVFFLGMFTRRVGQRAALAALVFGFAAMTAIFFGTSLAWPWYALVGSLITVAAGLAASLVWPREAIRSQG
ncbi:MAG TPA: sodium:solute symporter [Thermoanaerobaculia bacterium]|jgi:SSS family transporter|nr:sodium:solute symporter [Thermoanaerobaculia bacterium]